MPISCEHCNMQIMQPRILERFCGGWLAVSPTNATLRIGVTASSKEGALKAFSLAAKRWADILYDA